VALTSRLQSFETDLLAQEHNLAGPESHLTLRLFGSICQFFSLRFAADDCQHYVFSAT